LIFFLFLCFLSFWIEMSCLTRLLPYAIVRQINTSSFGGSIFPYGRAI
jgi:hypothetical protein